MLGDLQQNRGSVSAAVDSYQKATELERLAQTSPISVMASQQYPDNNIVQKNFVTYQKTLKKYSTVSPLLEQAKQRNDQAFLELFRRNAYIIQNILRKYQDRIVGYDEDDLNQEIRLRAYEIIPDFHGDDISFQHWLRRLTHGLCSNLLKKQRQHELIDPEYPSKELVEHTLSSMAFAEYHRQQAYVSVEEAIAELPEVFRQAVILYIDGLSYKEIAAALNIGTVTVKIRLHRARAILRNIL